MNEREWVDDVAARVQRVLRRRDKALEVRTGQRIAYGHEISAYGSEAPTVRMTGFQTDLVLIEHTDAGAWLPRVIVEAKINAVTTHDAITYSQKAAAHRAVHPYLRYGIMLGNRKHHPLPGRLYRHGAQFDFMISFRAFEPAPAESKRFLELLLAEVDASRTMERLLYESRKRGRKHYCVLHRRLEVQ